MQPLRSRPLDSAPDIFNDSPPYPQERSGLSPYPQERSGLSPYQNGSSLFSRGRVLYRRELVQPLAENPWGTNPVRHHMKPAPNALPQRRTTLWGLRNLPFSIQYPSRVESMVFYDPAIQAYIPEPFSTMQRDGSIVIPDADVLVRHAFDKVCAHILHKASENLVIHNVEGTLKAYLWPPGAVDHLIDKSTVQRCIHSLPDLAKDHPPQKETELAENEVLHVPKDWVVGLQDVDNSPHTLVSFHYKNNS